MTLRKPWMIALLAAAAMPTAVMAQSSGPYISGALGFVQPTDADITGTGINTEAQFDPGFAAAFAIGTTLKHNWRGEAELSYRRSDIDSLSGVTNGQGDVGGPALMLNAFYDFQTGTLATPYIGAGLGGMRLDVDGATPVGGSNIDEGDWVGAAQAIAGVNFKISDRLGVFTDYRYLVTSDPEFTTAAGADVESEYSEHRFMIGLRWSFGAPKPAPKAEPVAQPIPAPEPAPAPKVEAKKPEPKPEPAPAPQVARQFLVFFDWDQAVLTDDAKAIVMAAAQASKQVPVKLVEATGHADRSGTDRYNLGLSKRRADAVKAELIRLGLNPGDIGVQFKGEREPLVQTADGIREPQNRRVEIILK